MEIHHQDLIHKYIYDKIDQSERYAYWSANQITIKVWYENYTHKLQHGTIMRIMHNRIQYISVSLPKYNTENEADKN